MKNKISFLVITTLAFATCCANASECVGTDCEFMPAIIEQPIDTINVIETTNIQESCTYDYGCPFESDEECSVWYKKPVHKTTLSPRAPHINPVRVDDMLFAIYSDYNISANNAVMMPLLERYEMLTRASRACCSEGIIYKMHQNGATDADVYNFLKDDANYFAIMTRCMMMNDEEIQHSYSNGVTGQMVADVRNACLCKNREWFENLLQPFNDIYTRAPQFRSQPFTYTYTDDMQREIIVYINNEVQTTSGLLSACPK